MKILEDKIRAEGRILPGPVLKVSSFLNHQMDADLIMELGKELADRFRADGVTKILTIESSGIAIALAVGAALHVPVLFAKKHRTSNVSGVLYQTLVHSYTHGTDYTVVVEREYLKADDRVLIIDDFLANGKAVEGLLDLSAQAGAAVVGAGIVIEKGFQDGGTQLRASGLRVESLAIIDSMDENGIVFRES
ncbi:MAG: xanthine phosphoribosyltransferase [Oscillospiraceae bacterium]|nr:xanthine phosphoribosyltransferase [Oscillospiraceae bacterium]MBR5722646.1 xanthine phosphoribosyltransferase [Oscillospiraceae bacterium]